MSYDELIESAHNKSCKFIVIDEALANMLSVGNYCTTLVKTGKSFQVRGASFVIPRNWTHNEDLRSATLVGQQQQLVPDLESYVAGMGKCEPLHGLTITFRELYVFFAIVFSVCGAMLLFIVLYD